MPPRIYQRNSIDEKRIIHIGSIYNRKKNSELFLSPIQISHSKKNKEYVVGGGRKFLSMYNLEKMVVETMYNKFDKTNVSAVGMLN